MKNKKLKKELKALRRLVEELEAQQALPAVIHIGEVAKGSPYEVPDANKWRAPYPAPTPWWSIVPYAPPCTGMGESTFTINGEKPFVA